MIIRAGTPPTCNSYRTWLFDSPFSPLESLWYVWFSRVEVWSKNDRYFVLFFLSFLFLLREWNAASVTFFVSFGEIIIRNSMKCYRCFFSFFFLLGIISIRKKLNEIILHLYRSGVSKEVELYRRVIFDNIHI